MYGFEEHFEITPEQLLQKITQEQIIEFVLEEPFNFSLRYKSPFRPDNNPGCRFEQRADGKILFVDFAEKSLTGRTHRTCFSMVMDKHGVTLTGAIKMLCEHFGISKKITDYAEIKEVDYHKRISTPSDTVITYDKRLLTKSDIIYWSESIIKPEHLLQDNVYPIRRFNIIKTSGVIKRINVYGLAYAIDFIDRVKIYQPFRTTHKWITNCHENNIGNIDNLPYNDDKLIIQKSYKDHRVIRNLIKGSNVIWFQNEGCVPSLEILTNLTERFKEIVIFYDNDYSGIMAAMKLVDVFNSIRPDCCSMVHLPVIKDKPEYKDPSYWVKKEGRKDTLIVLKQIGL